MVFDHVAIIVSSEKSLAFYEKLGFIECNRFERANDIVIIMKEKSNPSFVLELFIDPNHPERVTSPEAKGLRHLALGVENFDEAIAEFNAEDIRTDWFGRRFTFVKDPDGLPIELKEL